MVDQLKAGACFGDSADGALLERRADQVTVGGHLADRPFDVPPPEPVQAPVPECGHVAWDVNGPANDFRGFPAVIPQCKSQRISILSRIWGLG